MLLDDRAFEFFYQLINFTLLPLSRLDFGPAKLLGDPEETLGKETRFGQLGHSEGELAVVQQSHRLFLGKFVKK